MVSNRAVSLFSAMGIQQHCVPRIESLLDVLVSDRYGLPCYICLKCKLRVVLLEKAASDLKAFKQLVPDLHLRV